PSRPIHLENWPAGTAVAGSEPSLSPQRAEYERMIRRGVLYGNAWSAPALLTLIAIWKAILFVPVMVLIFQWCRAVYGLGAAWVTQPLILFDPTFAAHLPIAALDTLAVDAILIACFCILRYFGTEHATSLILASTATGAAV